jgi:HSP20 family protein
VYQDSRHPGRVASEEPRETVHSFFCFVVSGYHFLLMWGGGNDNNDPFRDFDNIVRRMFNIDGIAGGPLSGSRSSFVSTSSRGSWFPAMNLLETPSTFVLSADLPGMKKEDMEVNFKDGRLCVKGTRTIDWNAVAPDAQDSQSTFHMAERGLGSFERCVTLPNKIRDDSVRAEFLDGVLNVSMDKEVVGPTKGSPINIR